MSLARKLTRLRKKKGLTQLEVAEKLYVSRQAISRWEVGAAVPSTDNLRVLSDMYETTVDYLLDDEAEEYVAPAAAPVLENKEPEKKKGLASHWKIYLLAWIIFIAAVVVSVVIGLKCSNPSAVPLEDMEQEHNVGAPDETFSIDFPVE